MKKVIYTIACALLATTLMVGCNKAATADTQNTQATQSASTEDGSSKQKNFPKADLVGEVASIDGNKITLKVIKMPERPEGGNQKNAAKDGDKSKSQGNENDGQKPKGQESRQVEYTGENKDITISDGIKISAMNRGQKGSEAKELTAGDIKVGDMLQITYSDKEKETISNISVRPAVNQSGNAEAK